MSESTKFEKFVKHYLNDTTADVFFICGEGDNTERIPAHKSILSAFSDAFDTMFYGSLPESNDIKVPDASPAGFQTFLRWFYFVQFDLHMDVIGEVIYLAKKYLIDDCLQACCEFLRRKREYADMLIGFELAIRFDLIDLKSNLGDEITCNPDILCSESIGTISRELLKEILNLDFRLSNAILSFDACMLWSTEECKRQNIDVTMQNRRDQLGDCYECIEYSAMSRSDIVKRVEEFGDFFTAKELQSMLIMVAARWPGPSDNPKIKEYCIGSGENISIAKQKGSVEELRFSTRETVVLRGFEVHEVSCPSGLSTYIDFLLTIKKSCKTGNGDSIVLWKDVYDITSSIRSNELFEKLILEPNSIYSIEISTNMDYIQLTPSTGNSEQSIFSFLSGTNSSLIAKLHYSSL